MLMLFVYSFFVCLFVYRVCQQTFPTVVAVNKIDLWKSYATKLGKREIYSESQLRELWTSRLPNASE